MKARYIAYQLTIGPALYDFTNLNISKQYWYKKVYDKLLNNLKHLKNLFTTFLMFAKLRVKFIFLEIEKMFTVSRQVLGIL